MGGSCVDFVAEEIRYCPGFAGPEDGEGLFGVLPGFAVVDGVGEFVGAVVAAVGGEAIVCWGASAACMRLRSFGVPTPCVGRPSLPLDPVELLPQQCYAPATLCTVQT